MMQRLVFWFLFIHVFIIGSAQKVDSVKAAASIRYAHPSGLAKFFIGKNYRQEWATPVAMPIFYLKNSGLIAEKLGGGMQTKSLQLNDAQGREWALRTVDKNAKGALPLKMQ